MIFKGSLLVFRLVLVALVMAKVGLVMRRMLSITSSPPPPVLVDITKVDKLVHWPADK